jgi:Protein of unknown function (DUF2029).
MTKQRLDGLYIMILGCVVFLFLGGAGAKTSSAAMQDFKVLYYPAKCLLQHCDPYNEFEVAAVYNNGRVEQSRDSANMLQFATRYIYLPTSFPITVPFALLPLGIAQTLWMILTAGSLIFAAFLTWDLAADFSPIISGCLIGFLLANSEVLLILCNAAGLAVSLCVIAVWCFQRNTFLPAGICCLAVSLAIKPQDAGMIWLFFLLAGKVERTRALQTLVVTILLSLPAVLWTWQSSPHWMQEWHSNVTAFSAHGGLSDPGPDSANGYGLSMMVNLQPVFAQLRDDPRLYNFASYLVCMPLFLLWLLVTVRYRLTPRRRYLALAAVAALTMLPVYHRLNDTKLLLLAVPACTILWAEGGKVGRLAFLLTFAGLVLSGDLLWVLAMGIVGQLHLPIAGFQNQLLRSALVSPTPLMLLAISLFYLWLYLGDTNSKCEATTETATTN